MRTFRLIGMTLLMVMLTVNFTACSDDDEEQQDDKTLALLVGSWENELDSFTDVNGNVVSSTTEVLTFKADMTWTGIDYYTGTNYPNEKTEKWGEGTYSYDSSKKRLTLNNNIMEEYIDSIIRVGKILIGSMMVVFVLWYIVKDIVKAYGKDSHEPD